MYQKIAVFDRAEWDFFLQKNKYQTRENPISVSNQIVDKSKFSYESQKVFVGFPLTLARMQIRFLGKKSDHFSNVVRKISVFCRPENLIGMRISKCARAYFLLLRFLCTSKENEVAL
ncbi:hypothetical protein QV06_07010 [Gallibacterium genomosp. 3]|uniref:Uncharacterized protein n=1 Tax=Gallibacterium genomosp. 3 TaxID=505345 RepID=A0A1A7PPB2_9PAST|nr:hypothetical protein [Gallibacterium genomosp. 3]OBX04398.1 hypothetical protein QV06_07010 [Gallibacterium genomosp. 3]